MNEGKLIKNNKPITSSREPITSVPDSSVLSDKDLMEQNKQLKFALSSLTEEYEHKLSVIQESILSRERAENMLREKLRERQLSLENKQVEMIKQKQAEETIKNRIEENQDKIKEIEYKIKQDQKNERLTQLSQGKSPNIPRKITRKSSYSSLSLKKKIGSNSKEILPDVE